MLRRPRDGSGKGRLWRLKQACRNAVEHDDVPALTFLVPSADGPGRQEFGDQFPDAGRAVPRPDLHEKHFRVGRSKRGTVVGAPQSALLRSWGVPRASMVSGACLRRYADRSGMPHFLMECLAAGVGGPSKSIRRRKRSCFPGSIPTTFTWSPKGCPTPKTRTLVLTMRFP